MFNNILVPTDGSDLSHDAAAQAVRLAKTTGAHITALHVARPYTVEIRHDDAPIPGGYVSPDEYGGKVCAEAGRYLDVVKGLARASGIECSGHYVMDASPARAIVEAAESYRCDGIVMGSHCRSGLKKLLLGSVTQEVLVSTHLPVLVVR